MAIRDDIEKVSKKAMIIINIIFFILTTIVLIMGAVAVGVANFGGGSSGTPGLLESLDIGRLASILLMCGVLGVITAILGIATAIKPQQFRVCLILYVVLLLIICCVQLAMGAYLLDLEAETLRSSWNDDTATGRARREAYMDAMGCCGFDNIFEYQLQPACTAEQLEKLPRSCKAATDEFIDKQVGPAAVGAVVIGIFEIIAMICACFLVFYDKEINEDFQSVWHG